MSDWRAEFRIALIDEVVRSGTPVSSQPSYYGWMDHSYSEKRDQVKATGIDYAATTWEESYWDEFMGTFYEGDTRVYGIDLKLVLKDGTEFHWRYSGSGGNLIMALARGE